MIRKVMLLMTVMAVVFTAVSFGAAITPTAWKQSSAFDSTRTAANLGNANGMDGTQTYLYNLDGSIGGEPTTANNVEWVTRSESLTTAVFDQRRVWIVVDLGASYDLGAINIWNFQWKHPTAGDLSNRGISQFDIYVRDAAADTNTGLVGGTAINTSTVGPIQMTNAPVFNEGTSNKWQLALADQQIAQAPNNDTYAGQGFDLTGNYGRFVAIVADGWYGGGGAGFGKVRFEEGTGVAHQPDPSRGQTGVEIDLSGRIVPGAVSWLSPDDPDDPNIVNVFGYNLYMDPNQTKVINATPASTGLLYKSLQSGGQIGTSFDPGADLAYVTTYYWRVDAIVDYDYIPGSTINDANTIRGGIWSFTTINQAPTNVVAVSVLVPSAGSSGVLTVTADDPAGAGLTYHWYLDYDPSNPGTNILDLATVPGKYTGVTSASLTVTNVQPGYKLPILGGGDENFYYCDVQSTLGGTVVKSNYARLAIKRLVSRYALDTEDNYTDSVGDWDGFKVGDPNLTGGYIGGAHQFVATHSDGVGINMVPTPPAGPGPWPSTGTEYTVTAWVWFDGSTESRWKIIAANGNFYDTAPDNFRFFDLALSNANHLVLGYKGENDYILDGSVMPTGEWQFVAAVADGSTYRLYRMGANDAQAVRHGRNFQVASRAYTAPILDPIEIPSISGIGCRMRTNAPELGAQPCFWNGKIDDVRVYNYGLSPEAVADIYGQSVCLYESGESWLTFDYNQDCQVTLPDFAALAAEWLKEGIYP